MLVPINVHCCADQQAIVKPQASATETPQPNGVIKRLASDACASARACDRALPPVTPCDRDRAQHSTLNTQHSALNTQHSTLNTHHSTINIQHSDKDREAETPTRRLRTVWNIVRICHNPPRPPLFGASKTTVQETTASRAGCFVAGFITNCLARYLLIGSQPVVWRASLTTGWVQFGETGWCSKHKHLAEM
jgi:hypothetical protein